jgi:hypothetical protein
VRTTSAKVYVNKKLVKSLKGKALKRPFELRDLPSGRFRLAFVLRGKKHGKRVTIRDRRTYGPCRRTAY